MHMHMHMRPMSMSVSMSTSTRAGLTIICVIHQPRASILPLFDQVLLLGAGKVVYQGPSCNYETETDTLRKFFADANHPCPAFENPAVREHRAPARRSLCSD